VTITNNSYKCDEYDKVRANKEESDFILFLSAFPSLKFRLFARSSKKVAKYLELSGLIFSTPSSDLSRVDNH
jgi:hypothetical protein